MKKNFKKMAQIMAVGLTVAVAMTGCASSSAPKTEVKPQTTAAAGTASEKGKFPERAITMIVPFAPGGSTDLLARAIEKTWSKYSSQQLLIVNKPNAGGVEGMNIVAKSKPDGYNIVLGYGSGQDVVMPFLQDMPYDPTKDLAPIALTTIVSIMVAVPENSPFKTLKDVVEFGKKDPTPITAAVSTTGGTVDFVMRGLGKRAGINIVPIPHQGGSQAITSLIGGQTMIGGGTPSEIMPQVKSGKLRVLGVCFPERDPVIPDVPTFKEQGIDFSTWGALRGVAAPAGTPKEIIDYISDVLKKISEDPDYKETMEKMFQPVMYKDTEGMSKIFKETYDEYGKMIKEFDIKLK